MIRTVAFFGATPLLLPSLLSEERALVPWRAGCASVAELSFSPGSWDSAGSHCVLPKRLWLRKRNIFSSIFKPWLAASGRPASGSDDSDDSLAVSVG